MSSSAIYAADAATGWRPWGALVPVLGIVLIAVPTAGMSLLLVHADLLEPDAGPIGLAGFVAFLLLPFGSLGLVILAWVRLVERRSLATIGLTGAAPVRTFLRGHAAGLAMAAATVAGIWIARGASAGGTLRALHAPASLGGIAILLVCFAVQSSVEEIALRGWMLSAIAARRGIVTAVVLTSLVFTLLHFDLHQPWLFTVNVFAFSVFACLWALRTGNIWGVMGWHAGWNWLLATGFELPVTGLDAHLPALLVKLTPRGPESVTGGAVGPEGSLFCSLILAGGIIAVAARRARRRLAPTHFGY
jgi:membrane protease YdiL (CAAX protease family)